MKIKAETNALIEAYGVPTEDIEEALARSLDEQGVPGANRSITVTEADVVVELPEGWEPKVGGLWEVEPDWSSVTDTGDGSADRREDHS
jgi:hypothetical protein